MAKHIEGVGGPGQGKDGEVMAWLFTVAGSLGRGRVKTREGRAEKGRERDSHHETPAEISGGPDWEQQEVADQDAANPQGEEVYVPVPGLWLVHGKAAPEGVIHDGRTSVRQVAGDVKHLVAVGHADVTHLSASV